MRKLFEEKLGLTPEGARGLVKSTWASFFVYVVIFASVMLALYYINLLMEKEPFSFVLVALLCVLMLLVLYLSLNKEYILMYDETYKEAANLRITLASKLSKMPLSYFSKHDLSDLAQTFIADIFALEHALSHAVGKIASFLMSFVVIVIMLIVGDWRLGLSVFIPTALYIVLLLLSRKVQVAEYDKYYHILRDNSDAFQEAIEHQQDIKSFNLRDSITQDLNAKMENAERVHIKTEFLSMIPLALSGILQSLSVAIVLIVGIYLLANGQTTLLFVLGYALAAIKIKDAISSMAGNITELYYLSPMVKRIKEIRNYPLAQGEKETFKAFDITLSNVDFSYEPDLFVVKDCTLHAKQGKVTALVGKSGCGKTSLLRLISRLYDPDAGSITIGEHNIAKIDTSELYHNVSMVFQEVNLFNGTILENIRLGRTDATDEEVKEAARLANCVEFIEQLPEGYDTLVGENGASLSGGQRQRLSIARAFLKDAPILLLDEIAGSLDIENEQKIQSSLNQLMKNKTVIIVSHRMKSIQNVSNIAVMSEGRVVQLGSHEELLERSPLYCDLVEKSRLAEQFEY